MPRIDIEVGLNADGVASAARSAAREAGDAIDSEVSSSGKSAARAAGSSIESEVQSSGRSAGREAGDAIAEGVESGGRRGADGASSAIESISSVAKAAFGAIGVTGALGGIDALAGHAAEAQSQMSRLEASARANSVSAETMGGTYSQLVGVLGDTDRVVETSGNLFALCGDNQAQLQSMTTALTGAYSQFGDGMPVEALAEAANETAKVGTVTGSLADALNWSSASAETWSSALGGNRAAQDAFNEAIDAGLSKEDAYNAALAACSDEQERAQAVTDTLTALYGEQGEAYVDANEDLIAYNQTQDELSTASAELGEALMPVQTGLTEIGTAVLEGVQPGLSWLTGEALPWLVSNLPVIAPLLVAVGAGFAAWAVVQTLSGVPAMLASLKDAILGVNAAMSANPIGVVVALITALVAAIVYLWNTNEDFRAFVETCFAAIQDFVGGVVDAVVGFFTDTLPSAIDDLTGFFQGLWDSAVTIFEGALDAVSDFVDGAVRFFTVTVPQAVSDFVSRLGRLPGEVASWLASALSRVASWALDMASKATQAASGFISNVVSWLSSLPGRVWDFLSGAISRAASFVSDMASKATQAASGFVSNVASFLSSLPGRVWDFLSGAISSAASFVSDFASRATQAASQFVSNIVSGLSGVAGSVMSVGSDIVHGIWNGISGAAGWLWNQISGWADGIIGNIKGFFGIASPSKVMRAIFRWLPAGAALGIEDDTDELVDAAEDMAGRAVDGVRVGVSAGARVAASGAASQVGAIASYSSAAAPRVVVDQQVNFNQPVQTPDQTARAMRMYGHYGLAGVV